MYLVYISNLLSDVYTKYIRSITIEADVLARAE